MDLFFTRKENSEPFFGLKMVLLTGETMGFSYITDQPAWTSEEV